MDEESAVKGCEPVSICDQSGELAASILRPQGGKYIVMAVWVALARKKISQGQNP